MVGDDPQVRRVMRHVLPGVLVVGEAHGVREALARPATTGPRW